MIAPETFARYAAMRVPRYTSYPTAPNFSPAVDQAEYRRWLRSLPGGSRVSIYMHIPFCREMCWYCGCHTSVSRRQAPISRYVDTLVREIDLVAAELQAPLRIGHLHWGGGSPTLVTSADIRKVYRSLSGRFELETDAEHSVEVDPRTLSEEVARAFGAMGVNRASVGVQSFDPAVQLAINRVQGFETTARAVEMLRQGGVRSINFDLVYGLPFQTVRSCVDTVEQALRLRPQRLAVFGYAHVPGFKPHQRRISADSLPGLAERHAQADAIAQLLVSAGYSRIGIDHFALPGDALAVAAEKGRLHRNFQGYTTDQCDALVGFGASAIGRLHQGFVQNAAKIPDYQRRIDGGRLAIVRGARLSGDDSRRGAIIEQLMCNYRAEIGDLDAPLDQLERDGLVRRSNGWIEVAEEARPLVRAVAAAFDEYLPQSAAAHVTAL